MAERLWGPVAFSAGAVQKQDGTLSVKGERFWSLREIVEVPSYDFR